MLAHALKAPLRICRRLLRSGGRPNYPLLAAIFVLAGVQIAIVALSSWADGAWYLPHGKGLSQHLAGWVIPLLDPLLLLSAGFLTRQFLLAMTTLPIQGVDQLARVRAQVLFWRKVMRASGKYQYIYFIFFVPNFFGWLMNVIHTRNPVTTYQHDVFDSASHFPSFVTFKITLFLSWVVIYPPIEFVFITTAFATWRILRDAERNALVVPRVEHPDQCYGLKNVGTLNIALLSPFLLVAASMYSIFETHKTLYPSIVVPMFILACLFLCTSVVVIRPVHLMLSKAKRSSYGSLIRRIERSTSAREITLQLALERFVYSTANASPYSTGTKMIVVAMRGISAVPLVLKLIR